MIDIELLRRVGTIYCHGHCPDGLASAMVLKDAFRMLGTAPHIVFLDHGTLEHKTAGIQRDVPLFCDITPWHETAAKPGALHPETVVLDHHAGVKELVQSFGARGVYADAETEPGVSGTVLAFREVWQPVNMATGTHDFLLGDVTIRTREFAECIGIRDTWRTKSPLFARGQWMSKMLMSKPASYWLDEVALSYLTEEEVQGGRVLFEAHLDSVRQAVGQCVRYDVPDGDRLVGLAVFQEQATGFRLTSDVAEALRADWPTTRGVVAGFSWVVDADKIPKLTYSLRGLGGFDVCALAKANGGGGHKGAAGFSFIIGGNGFPGPYVMIQRRLAAHLESLRLS